MTKMIKSIRMVNFKSIGDLSLGLDRFNCLVGMNGAGKSTVLQAFDFLSHIMQGDVDAWLKERNWNIGDLNNKLRKENNITINVVYELENAHTLNWSGVFNRTDLRCTREHVIETGVIPPARSGRKLLLVDKGTFSLDGKPRQEIAFTYQGSILSVLKESELPASLLEFRSAIKHMRSLELLSPQLLRKRARSSDHDIGFGGEKLSAFLDGIKGQKKDDLLVLLRRFYPAIVDFRVSTLKSGWKKLMVQEQFEGKQLETEATHLNDGLLRMLAVLAQSSTDRSLILLDEIENGINQEIVEALVDTLVESPQQLVITTHSPLVLNYLTDAVARKSVQLIYKSPAGETRVRRFFDIPRMAEKLNAMGPGDAFVDTDLNLLTQECIELDRQSEASIRAEEVAEANAMEEQ
jgi:predicted ATPase